MRKFNVKSLERGSFEFAQTRFKASMAHLMIVCADDFGLSADINATILELCAARRVTAVSCMVVLERCDRAALQPLLEFGGTSDIGLHLCFTDEGLPLSGQCRRKPRGFRNLLWNSVSGGLKQQELESEVAQQYGIFLEKTGRAPDFIDGHLHAHQLPVVRKALVRFLLTLPPERRPYVRNTFLPSRELRARKLPCIKAGFIGFFGKGMLRLLTANGIRTNRGFGGIYDFRDSARYGHYLPKFVDCLRDSESMLVVHPGGADEWRRKEAEALRAFKFPDGSPNRFAHGPERTSAMPWPT